MIHRISLSIALLFLILFQIYSQKTTQINGNPVFFGWYADPEVAVFGKKFWIYPTYSADYNKQVYLDAFSSSDLVNWTKHTRIVDTSLVKWARRAVWAPAVIEKGGKYFLFFGANDIQNNEQKGGIGVAVADKPEGPFKDYLGKPLISQFYNGAQPIDQFVFQDKDGKYYIIYGGWGHCNVAQLNDDFTSVIPMSDGVTFKEITPQGYVEGPVMFMRNGKYYFMWSEGSWIGPDYCVAYAIGESVTGPFIKIGKVLNQDSSIATGAGHHSVLNIPGTDEWYIIYHRRPKGKVDANEREVCIEKMTFDNEGKIVPMTITTKGVGKVKM